MFLPLQEVQEITIMKNAKLMTGNEHLESKVVEWVSVIEVPVENFVRKNEFVLSTGIGCGQDEELLLQFVKELIDAKASALAIATGRHIKDIPKSVLEYAKNKQFPIFVIPWETRFADIIQGILTAIHKQKKDMVEKSEEIQQKLLQLILQGGGLQEIANFIFKTLKKPLIITDKRGLLKGESKKAKTLKEDWKDYLHSEDYANSLHPFESNNFITSPKLRYITLANHSVLQMMIQSSSEVQGYLIICVEEEEIQEENSSTIQLLEHAVTAIALCFLRENTIRETEMRLRDDFVWSLAKGTLNSWDQILSRSKSLGYQVSLPYVCIIGYPENLNTLYKKNNPEKASYENWVQNMVKRLEDEIFYTGRTIHCQTLSTYQRDHFIVFLEIKNKSVENTVQQFIDLICSRLKQLFPKLILSWGIGKSAGVNCFRDSYHEAQTALQMGRRQKGIGHQSTYADTRIDRALMNLVNNDELKKITDSTIGGLLKYDKERNIDLINTYRTYSKNRRNVSQTARELNLHRQSLLYRLRKIETLSDCKLENHDDVLLLDLSIKLWTVGILDNKMES